MHVPKCMYAIVCCSEYALHWLPYAPACILNQFNRSAAHLSVKQSIAVCVVLFFPFSLKMSPPVAVYSSCCLCCSPKEWISEWVSEWVCVCVLVNIYRCLCVPLPVHDTCLCFICKFIVSFFLFFFFGGGLNFGCLLFQQNVNICSPPYNLWSVVWLCFLCFGWQVDHNKVSHTIVLLYSQTV